MQKLRTSIWINASRQKVWDAMLADATYREWTEAFCPGSHYVGSWEEGSKILFLGPGKEGGEVGGMVSYIRANRPQEYLSMEHVGVVSNGVEDCSSEATKGWSGARESYTFVEKDGGTELQVEMDVTEEEMARMQEMWKGALAKLKEISER